MAKKRKSSKKSVAKKPSKKAAQTSATKSKPTKATASKKPVSPARKSGRPEAEFPYRREDEQALKEGEKVARARYYRSVRSTAKEILDEFAPQYGSYDQASGSIMDRIREEADSHVIYDHRNIDTVVNSDNWLAGSEEESISTDDFSEAIRTIAYHAYVQDLVDSVDEQSTDIEWGDEDEEDGEED